MASTRSYGKRKGVKNTVVFEADTDVTHAGKITQVPRIPDLA
ncbi:hypothetical protein [Mesorhizobium sp. M1396]